MIGLKLSNRQQVSDNDIPITNPGGNKPGDKPGTKPGSGQQGMGMLGLGNKEIAKMAAEQTAIRQRLEQLRNEMNKEGQGKGNQLNPLIKELEQQEKDLINKRHNVSIKKIDEIDNFNDIDGLASLIDACDLVVTSSNVTSHIAGAIGKKTYLIAPFGLGKIWYWDQPDGQSIWYSSVYVINQNSPADINMPIQKMLELLNGEKFENN